MFAAQDGVCTWCKLPLPEDFTDTAIDHIIPRCWGGPDVSWNRQLLHFKCNAPDGKGDKLTDGARELAELRGIVLRRTPGAAQAAERKVAIPPGVMPAAIHALQRAGLEVDEDIARVIIVGILPALERHVRREIAKSARSAGLSVTPDQPAA